MSLALSCKKRTAEMKPSCLSKRVHCSIFRPTACRRNAGVTGKEEPEMTDRHALLTFLADETHAALLRAHRLGAPRTALNEAEELMAIRLNILRRQDNEAQLELPLDIKAAA